MKNILKINRNILLNNLELLKTCFTFVSTNQTNTLNTNNKYESIKIH